MKLLPREFELVLRDFPKLKLYELGTYHLLKPQFPFFSFLEIMLRSLKEQTCNDSSQSKIKQKTPLTPVNSTIIRFLLKSRIRLFQISQTKSFKIISSGSWLACIKGCIDIGDGYWRRNQLVTTLGCW